MKRKVQDTILVVLGLLIVVLLVGGLTALLFQGFYRDPNPLLNLVGYALDLNRSVYVWLGVLVAAYGLVSARGEAMVAFVERLHAGNYPGPLRTSVRLVAAALVGLLTAGIVAVVAGLSWWNYPVSLGDYWQTHRFSEVVDRLFANLDAMGFLIPLGLGLVFVVSVVVSFVVLARTRTKGRKSEKPRSPL